jgi:hypothetical protein
VVDVNGKRCWQCKLCPTRSGTAAKHRDHLRRYHGAEDVT